MGYTVLGKLPADELRRLADTVQRQYAGAT
jgi:anti-sigma factor RsiW